MDIRGTVGQEHCRGGGPEPQAHCGRGKSMFVASGCTEVGDISDSGRIRKCHCSESSQRREGISRQSTSREQRGYVAFLHSDMSVLIHQARISIFHIQRHSLGLQKAPCLLRLCLHKFCSICSRSAQYLQPCNHHAYAGN